MKKILHFIPTLEGGGAERQLALLVTDLVRRGWDTHIGVRRAGVNYEKLAASGVTVHFLGDYRNLSPRLLARIHRVVREIRPDVVQTWLPQMDVLGGTVALLNSVPWILSERNSRLAFDRMSLIGWFRKFLGRYADAVVANSGAGVKYWKSILPAEANIELIANVVDTLAIRNAPAPSFVPTEIGAKLFLVVGRLNYQKAVDIVIRAISRIHDRNDIKVFIFGDGPQRMELEQLIISLDLVEKVKIHRYRSDWWGFLKVATALISMSRFEGQPNVVLETMAAGCPLIVSDIPEHRELLTEESATFAPPDDYVALAESIDLVLAGAIPVHQKASHASAIVDAFTMDLASTRYDACYEQVIQRRHS